MGVATTLIRQRGTGAATRPVVVSAYTGSELCLKGRLNVESQYTMPLFTSSVGGELCLMGRLNVESHYAMPLLASSVGGELCLTVSFV